MSIIFLYPEVEDKRDQETLEYYKSSLAKNEWPSGCEKLEGYKKYDVWSFRLNDKRRVIYTVQDEYVIGLAIDKNHRYDVISNKTIKKIISERIHHYQMQQLEKEASLNKEENLFELRKTKSEKKEEEEEKKESYQDIKGIRTLFVEKPIEKPHTKMSLDIPQQDPSLSKRIVFNEKNKTLSKFDKAKNKVQDIIDTLANPYRDIFQKIFDSNDFNALFRKATLDKHFIQLLMVLYSNSGPLNINIFSRNPEGLSAKELALGKSAKNFIDSLYFTEENLINRFRALNVEGFFSGQSLLYSKKFKKLLNDIYSLSPDSLEYILTYDVGNNGESYNLLTGAFIVKASLLKEAILKSIEKLNEKAQINTYMYISEKNIPDQTEKLKHSLLQVIILTHIKVLSDLNKMKHNGFQKVLKDYNIDPQIFVKKEDFSNNIGQIDKEALNHIFQIEEKCTSVMEEIKKELLGEIEQIIDHIMKSKTLSNNAKHHIVHNLINHKFEHSSNPKKEMDVTELLQEYKEIALNETLDYINQIKNKISLLKGKDKAGEITEAEEIIPYREQEEIKKYADKNEQIKINNISFFSSNEATNDTSFSSNSIVSSNDEKSSEHPKDFSLK